MAESSVPSTMKAWQYSSFEGGAEALKVSGQGRTLGARHTKPCTIEPLFPSFFLPVP